MINQKELDLIPLKSKFTRLKYFNTKCALMSRLEDRRQRKIKTYPKP